MSTNISRRNLQIITVLDSLSYGLIYGFISPYILKLGGTHVSVGILSIGNLIGEMLSPEVIKIFTHLQGKRYSLFFVINTAMITHLMMVLTSSYWFTILVRILFSITNQSQNLCLELLLNKAQNDEEQQKMHRNYSFLSGSGFILGPILSGYIFTWGFGYTGALAAFLALINSILLMSVEKGANDLNPEHTEKSVLETANDNLLETINTFKNSNSKHWDLLILKYLFTSCLLIFFSKYTQILSYNYKANSVVIGYTAAYINILVFAATYYTSIFKVKTEMYPVVFLTEICFFALANFMLLACYAPYYELYMIFLVPIAFLRSYISSLWGDLFSERKDESLSKLNNSASIVAGLTTPLLFGTLCNRIAHHAVIIFSCVPAFLCWGIVRNYSRCVEIDEGNESQKVKNS